MTSRDEAVVTGDSRPALVQCSACGASALARAYCSVCGQSLASPSMARRFAASPREPAQAFRLTTTLFPRLPDADLDAFRIALASGIVVVVALVVAGYLPIALVASALLVPLLLAVYLYSTDVYEDEPIRVILLTLAWGAMAGALFGLLLRELYPARVGPPADEGLATLVRVVMLPTLALGLMVLGPLALLPFRKFNDVLDGATFGAVSGATFVGAQIVAQSIDLLTAGARPGGDTWSWILRILEYGVAIPLIAGGAAAGVCGACWLRYRAQVRDRASLGLSGRPWAAVMASCALLVGANAALVLLRDVPRLVVLALLTVSAIVWLRRLIDVGLRQEAVEAATNEPLECQDCHRQAPAGSFCAECGIALRALPKRAASQPSGGALDPAAGPRGVAVPRTRRAEPLHDQPSRLAGARSLVAFLVAWAVVLAAAGALVLVLAPVTRPPCPDPTQPCPATLGTATAPGTPTFGQATGSVMRFGQTLAVDGTTWQVDFDPSLWALDSTDPSGALWLTTSVVAPTLRGNTADIGVFLRLHVVPVEVLSVDQMMESLAVVSGDTLESSVARDEHATRLLRPHIGFRDAVARYLVGDVGAEGALTPYGAHLLAASDGRLTTGIILFVGQPDESFPFFSGSVRTTRFVGDLLDDVVKRFYWTEAGP